MVKYEVINTKTDTCYTATTDYFEAVKMAMIYQVEDQLNGYSSNYQIKEIRNEDNN